MNEFLDGIFRGLGTLPTDGSFSPRFVAALKQKYLDGAWEDDAFLHAMNFFLHAYGKDVDVLLAKALKQDEAGAAKEAMAIFDKANADGVPEEVYGYFLNRLLAHCCLTVDPAQYQSLAEYDPAKRLMSETMGAFVENPTNLIIDAGKGSFNRYIGKAKAVLVPNGVKTVGDSAFSQNGVAFVCLPDSVTRIGKKAFADCPNLLDVRLPQGLEDLPDGLFENDDHLSLYCSKGAKTIGKAAFKNTRVPFGPFFDGVTSIGEEAFMGDAAITVIRLPSSVSTIGIRAFSSCARLSAAFVKGDVDVGPYAFENTPKLTTIEFQGEHTVLRNNVFSNSHLFALRMKGGKITANAFQGCTGLAKVEIEGAAEIEPNAFQTFIGLSVAAFGQEEVHVGAHAFAYSGLTELTFPKGKLGEEAFSACQRLASVTINGETKIGKNCFKDDKALNKLSLADGVEVSPYAFASCGFPSLRLGKGRFDAHAFDNNATLKEVEITDPAFAFRPGVFSACPNVHTLLLPRLISESGHPFVALFSATPYEGAEQITTDKGAFYLHPLKKLVLANVEENDRLPEGLTVEEIHILAAKKVPSEFFSGVKGLKNVFFGPEVEEIEGGFDSAGFSFTIDPNNNHLVQENGLLLTKDRKTVLVVLDPQKLSPDILDQYEGIGATLFRDEAFDRYVFGADSPRFGAHVFHSCHFGTIVIEDFDKLSDETFLDCSVERLEILDAKGTPVFLPFASGPKTLIVPCAEQQYLETLFRGQSPIEEMRVTGVEIASPSSFPAARNILEDCTLRGEILHEGKIASLTLDRCHLRGAMILSSSLESLTLNQCDGEGLDCSSSAIQNASIASETPTSLCLLHRGYVPVHVDALSVTAPKLQSKGGEPIEAERLDLSVPSFEADSLHGVYGKELRFLVPVKEIQDYAFAYSAFESAEVAEGSCFEAKMKQRFLVDRDGIAFHALDAAMDSLVFDEEIHGYSPALFVLLRESAERLTVAPEIDVSDQDFTGFTSLSRLYIGNQAKPLGDIFPDSPIEEVTFVGDEVGDNFLEGLLGLTAFHAKQPLRFLGFRSFADCPRLQQIDGLEGAEEVGDSCFAGDAELRSLNLGQATRLGFQPLFGCTGLKSLSVNADALGDKPLATLFSTLPSRGGHKVEVDGVAYYVPEGLSEVFLRGNAFPAAFLQGFPPAAVTFLEPPGSAGDHAFAAMASVSGDLSTLTHIGKRAFFGCALPNLLDLPRVRSIGEEAFGDVSGLKRIHLGSPLTDFHPSAFAGFRPASMEDFSLEPGAYRIDQCCLYRGEKILRAFNVPEFPQTLTLPEAVKELPEGCFFGIDALEELSLPGVRVIEEGAIGYNANLASLSLGQGLERWGKIRGCPKLSTVIAPCPKAFPPEATLKDYFESIAKIERLTLVAERLDPAFLQGAKLLSLDLTLSSKEPLKENFFDGRRLQSLRLANPEWTSLPRELLAHSGRLQTLDLYDCPQLILTDANFSALTHLETLRLPSLSEPMIDLLPQKGWGRLKRLEIAMVPEFKENMFQGLASLESIRIEKNPPLIARGAFFELPLEEAIFGAKVFFVEAQAFRGCSKLRHDKAFFASLVSVGKEAFYENDELPRSIDCPELTQVGERAFAHSQGLHHLDIGSGGRITLEKEAFRSVPLSHVRLNGEVALGEGCFRGCFASSGALTVDGHLRSVGPKAFEGCAKLTLFYSDKKDLDVLNQKDPDWKRHRFGGSKEGLLHKLFHSPNIKLKKTP